LRPAPVDREERIRQGVVFHGEACDRRLEPGGLDRFNPVEAVGERGSVCGRFESLPGRSRAWTLGNNRGWRRSRRDSKKQ
jgi:hypothetical protein